MKTYFVVFAVLLICNAQAHIYIVPVPLDDGRFLLLPSSRRIVEVPKQEWPDKKQQVASLFDSRITGRFLK